ncbi:Gfo/Idh/MocA family protein [Clostridium chauvoei]|uniref:Putative dehydrogenase, YULF B.subtilis ortholog n=1 Tax=Clostridium chauvoei JF4335 TaxID=1351755 RepID=S6EMT0_9CLOT|nr:Gfo/Idh/MocA family oxidoreductase [Clostridium chauvoei]QBJ76068.1 gfo/Idh/MocA family oxidoreductase [Clostridium chauvoei]CDG02487.1 Putative Predicted dehydrogenase, YULF B.subtilis ortholog [Clostridium chauvoei JF4335]SLK21518.1 putative dehydrogenase, YULF B.subtilis ortholog [Clostridium chauvoei JF4335]
MDNEIVRFGVIGTNNITEWFLKGAKDVKRFKLEAVYSRTEEKAKAFGGKYGVKNIFTNLEEMAKSNLIDAVYIASPNALHAKQTILFLENNKHVLCEKAFASNEKEVNEMIKKARENNVVLMEAMKTTLFPNFKLIKDNLHKIGKVRRYFASFCQYSSRYDKYKAGEVLNAFKPELSNGSLMDIGVYCIAPMVNLFGKPNTVKATAMMLESGVDGEGSLILGYDDMDGVVIYSKISNSYLPSEIQGEKGSIIIDKINAFNNVKIIYRDGNTEEISVNQKEDDMCYEIEEFINLILNKKLESDVNTLENSRIVMKIMDEARKQIGLRYIAD